MRKPMAWGICFIWIAVAWLNPVGPAQGYLGEDEIPQPETPREPGKKSPPDRKPLKRPPPSKESAQSRSQRMIRKGEQMIAEGEALKQKGQLLIRKGTDLVEKGKRKLENQKWLMQQKGRE